MECHFRFVKLSKKRRLRGVRRRGAVAYPIASHRIEILTPHARPRHRQDERNEPQHSNHGKKRVIVESLERGRHSMLLPMQSLQRHNRQSHCKRGVRHVAHVQKSALDPTCGGRGQDGVKSNPVELNQKGSSLKRIGDEEAGDQDERPVATLGAIRDELVKDAGEREDE